MEQGKEYRINNSTIKIIFGNIVDSQTDVIVSCDDCYISTGGGVSKAISYNAGHNSIRRDVDKHTPADLGNVIVSSAGLLPHKYIFHAITIDFRNDNQLDNSELISLEDVHQYIIEHSIDKCFQLLQTMNLTSIAFPSIGAGVAGIPFEKVADAMSESIARNLRKTKKSLLVELYLHDIYNRMDGWDFLTMFEHFSAQEAIAKMINEQNNNRLDTENYQISNRERPSQDIDKDIFISYSRKDISTVKQIYELLEKTGLKCWLDIDGMFSGVSYKKVIVDAIKGSKILLFLSSENSNKSRNVISEVSIAMEYVFS